MKQPKLLPILIATAAVGLFVARAYTAEPKMCAQTAPASGNATASTAQTGATTQELRSGKTPSAQIVQAAGAGPLGQGVPVAGVGSPAQGVPAAGVASEAPGTSSAAKGKPAQAQVLAPDQFFGRAAVAYEAAQQIPDICAKLFCYCGCDMTDKHRSLLDCYTCDHSADCQICQDEALLALTMHKDGKSMIEIQRAVDQKFAKEYPFREKSPAFRQYQATRLWEPIKEQPAVAAESAAGTAKLLPGKKAGNCCGKHAKSQSVH
jgi:hypothetical protein